MSGLAPAWLHLCKKISVSPLGNLVAFPNSDTAPMHSTLPDRQKNGPQEEEVEGEGRLGKE